MMEINEARLVVRSPDRSIFGILEHMPQTRLAEKLAAKYPDQRTYLPIARKLDGTLTDWEQLRAA